ncbi:MAG TPA: response regulator, partial [Patescibacteria group bacterium]|nr:response regulator [Patescibacteria group bacterium]
MLAIFGEPTMKNGHILFVDNVESFLRERSEFLEAAGYKVLKATSLEEAVNFFEEARVHLAILDIRIEDDVDDYDTSGIELANNERYKAIPKIMLTGFPTYEAVRNTLSSRVGEKSAAVAFLSKSEGPEIMVQAVKEAFAQHVRINWDLVIKWIEGSPIDFPYCVTHIEPELEKTLLPDRIDEFEDLFRKLFFEYEQITISQLIWSKEGRICLEVFAFSGEKEEQMIVTCGRVNDLEAEEVNFNKHTPKGYPGFSQPIVKETFRYAAIARAISKQEIDLIMSFAFFFREMSEKQIRDALENLYQSTMASWHLQDLTSEGIESLAQTYRNRMNIVEDHYPLEGLKAYMEMLTEEAQSKRLMEDIFIQDSTITFKFPNGQSITLPDPFTRLYEDASFPKPEIMYGTTLGGLSANSILVDRECQTWPTDFSRIGTGLILKDYI